ncbi:MAG: NHLP bacteriocin system secretion protein [Spirochaetales bacterium]|nr:NHLP bacteriocin system secretion protein [Spirochaetales bacterium]
MKKTIFRKVALERISSPERLDRLMQVVTVRSWLVLAGIVLLIAFIAVWAVFGEIPVTANGRGILMKPGGIITIQHGTGGIIRDIRVKPGEEVGEGEVIALLNAVDDGERPEITSPCSGRVIEVLVNTGAYIRPGDPVVSLEPESGKGVNLEAVIYVPSGDGKKIRAGMDVRISPSTVRADEYGYLLGKVDSVAVFPASRRVLLNTLGSEALSDLVSRDGPVIAVNVGLVPSSTVPGGYKWSSAGGPKTVVQSGTLCEGMVIMKSVRPVSLLLPGLDYLE